MEHFWTDGGNNRPYFQHRIKVTQATKEMFDWCMEYHIPGHFARWHCEFGSTHARDYDIVQFEREEPALLFRLKFGHL